MRIGGIIAGAALVLGLGIGAGVLLQKGNRQDATVEAPAKPLLSLTDQDGKHVTDADFAGHWSMVFFGFTACPDVCPTTMTYAADLLKDLGASAEKMRIVFITIDPERDTAAALKAYLANFDPRIVGLTGTPEEIKVAADAFSVFYAKRPMGDTYTMDHSTALYLMNPEGSVLRSFAVRDGGADVTLEVKRYMAAAGDGPGIVISDAWARASLGQVPNTAAYLTIENLGKDDDKLLSVASPVAGMVQVHDSAETNGVMQMKPVEALAVAAGKKVNLVPGALHVMVMNLTAPLKAGDKMPLVLRFERAGEIKVDAEVRGLN